MDERKRGGEAEQNSSLRAGGDVQAKGASRNYLSAGSVAKIIFKRERSQVTHSQAAI